MEEAAKKNAPTLRVGARPLRVGTIFHRPTPKDRPRFSFSPSRFAIPPSRFASPRCRSAIDPPRESPIFAAGERPTFPFGRPPSPPELSSFPFGAPPFRSCATPSLRELPPSTHGLAPSRRTRKPSCASAPLCCASCPLPAAELRSGGSPSSSRSKDELAAALSAPCRGLPKSPGSRSHRPRGARAWTQGTCARVQSATAVGCG